MYIRHTKRYWILIRLGIKKNRPFQIDYKNGRFTDRGNEYVVLDIYDSKQHDSSGFNGRFWKTVSKKTAGTDKFCLWLQDENV